MIRIVKVGGSLLDWPALPQALDGWLDLQPSAVNVLICGGGRWADGVRAADETFHLGEEASHWLAIDCLAITAKLLATLCGLEVIGEFARLIERTQGDGMSPVVFDPRDFLLENERQLQGRRLPQDWTTTSDSIAARLAEALGAEELVLLKSSDPPGFGQAQPVAARYVDGHFAIASECIAAVRFINLRSQCA